MIVVFSFCVFAQDNAAKDTWETKPVDQWDETDVMSILKDSPWNQVLSMKSTEASRVFNTLIVLEDGASFTLRSALTVRLAIIRKRQLAEKYDSMNAKDQTQFNAKYKSVLECPDCEKFYIVSVVGDSRVLKNGGIVEFRKKNIYLSNEKGEKRFLGRYSPQVAPGSEALFYFPRNDEKGKPLLSKDDLTLTFNFWYDDQEDDPVIKLIEKVKVKVADIVRDGVVIF